MTDKAQAEQARHLRFLKSSRPPSQPKTIVLCCRCGFRADADPQFHAERYGHWPTIDHEGTLYNSDHLWATWPR